MTEVSQKVSEVVVTAVTRDIGGDVNSDRGNSFQFL